MKKKQIILLVEDEAVIALSQKLSLEKYGYTVVIAGTGEKAVDIIKQSSDIDLVLMDIDLGKGINGPETASKILSLIEIPIIFLSSHTEPETVGMTEEISSYGYVVKNSNITVLDASIKMAFKLFSANNNLKTTKNKLEATLNTLPDILFEVGLDGCYYDIHTHYKDLLYKPSKDLMGKKISDVLPSEASDIIISAIKEANEKGYSSGKHYSLAVPAGDHVFEIFTSPINFSSKNKRFVFLSRDITDTEKIKTKLLLSEKTYRGILDSISETIFIQDKDGIFLDVNKATEKMYGYSREYLIGKSPEFLSAPGKNDLVELKKYVQRAYSGKAQVFEFWGIKKDGTIFPKTVSLTSGDFFGERAVIAVARDISAQKHIEKTIKENNNILSSITNTMQSALIMIGREGRVTFWNPAAERILGYSAEEVLGKNGIENLLALEKNREGFKKALEQFLKTGKGKHLGSSYESEVIKKDGTIINVEIGLSSVNVHGIWHAVEVIRDISERVASEKRVANLLLEKETLLKEVHHRIKNNMNTIRSLLLLQAGIIENSPSIEVLEDAAGRVLSMMELYDKLYQSSDYNYLSSKEYIAPLITEIIKNFPNSNSVIVEKNIENFDLNIKKLQPLGIIVNELLTNIMKYAFPNINNGRIEVTLSIFGTKICLKIVENGKGIPAEIDFKNSTGFGMQLVSMLADQLDGTIRIERGDRTGIILEFPA